jgi:hypothetical protein
MAVQRTWGYPQVEGGPERRLWHVNAPGDYSLAGLTIYSHDEADARLLAAAPDLLDALRKIYAALMSDPPPGHVQKHVGPDDVIYQLDGQLMYQAINAARDAIAKAVPPSEVSGE